MRKCQELFSVFTVFFWGFDFLDLPGGGRVHCPVKRADCPRYVFPVPCCLSPVACCLGRAAAGRPYGRVHCPVKRADYPRYDGEGMAGYGMRAADGRTCEYCGQIARATMGRVWRGTEYGRPPLWAGPLPRQAGRLPVLRWGGYGGVRNAGGRWPHLRILQADGLTCEYCGQIARATYSPSPVVCCLGRAAAGRPCRVSVTFLS